MKILGILPLSIGGRLTIQSIFDGFSQLGHEIIVFDKLYEKEEKFVSLCQNNKFDFLVGYDFAGLKLKVDNNVDVKAINYFSDVIEDNHSGNYWQNYYEYLKANDNYTFYWDKELYLQKHSEIKNLYYMPHFVNVEIYKNFNNNPQNDIMFAGRPDTDFRLNTLLELMRSFKNRNFAWYAIEKHFEDAKKRTKDIEDIKLLERNYKGFISTEKDMAEAINNAKIFFNFNAQGISSLNYRTIQVMACERLLLSDDRKEIHELFSNGKDIVIYKDLEDLKSKIEFYLNDEVKRKRIAQNARKIIVKNHSSKVCVQKILDITNKI